jgi:hypothetical protein
MENGNGFSTIEMTKKFHKMELESNLFEFGESENMPFWDIIRYSVFCKYYFAEVSTRFSSQRIYSLLYYLRYLKEFINIFKAILFCKRQKNLILTASRYKNLKGEYFDPSATAIIMALRDNCIVLENYNIDKQICYPHIWNFSNILRRLIKTSNFPINFYQNISNVLIQYFGNCLISYSEINTIYHNFQCEMLFYRWLIRFMKIRRIFIATGNPKAIIFVARLHNIQTYLLQHSGIEIDEIEHSYPSGISKENNILFCDSLLTFGDYWGKNMNIPATVLCIGNDYFHIKPDISCDNSVLIISTTVHADVLRELTKNMAELYPDLQFNYKLHPNEFKQYLVFSDFFGPYQNVSVIGDEINTLDLIAKSQVVVLIVSGVLYQALNQNKKVAIYKKINYERNLAISENWQNVYFFDDPAELEIILKKKVVFENNNRYYKPLDNRILCDIVNS